MTPTTSVHTQTKPEQTKQPSTPLDVSVELMSKATDGSNRSFGVLKLTTETYPLEYKPKGKYRIHVSLDVSTSMREQNRLVLAKETIENMIEYLASTSSENPHLQFWITLTTFSTEARLVLNNMPVNADEVNNLNTKIRSISLESCTNFEASFRLDREIMDAQAVQDKNDGNDDIVTIHILETDGDITAGNRDETALKGMLDPKIEHVFIGYGSDHKAPCLMNLASVNKSSSYLFLDHPTKMGAYFAQIFCPHFYVSISEVEIKLTGAQFLDIDTGIEVSTMSAMRIAADTTKVYHILTDRQDTDTDTDAMASMAADCYGGCDAVSASVTYRSFDNADIDLPPNYPFRKAFSIASATTDSAFVQKERLRWKVMLFMKDVHTMKTQEQERYANRDALKEQKEYCMMRATELKDEIKCFAEKHDLQEDEMLKDLTTDIVVCICAIPSYQHGLMYVNSRFRSCADATPTAVSDLTPLDDYLNEFVHSSGYGAGDDNFVSCGGMNEEALYRNRSGATNTAFDRLSRAMSSQSQQPSAAAADDYDDDAFSNSSHVVVQNAGGFDYNS